MDTRLGASAVGARIWASQGTLSTVGMRPAVPEELPGGMLSKPRLQITPPLTGGPSPPLSNDGSDGESAFFPFFPLPTNNYSLHCACAWVICRVGGSSSLGRLLPWALTPPLHHPLDRSQCWPPPMCPALSCRLEMQRNPPGHWGPW
jgi:hypothetical protein